MFGDLPFADVGFAALYENILSPWVLINTTQVSNWAVVNTPSVAIAYIVTEIPSFLVTEKGQFIVTSSGWTPVDDQQSTSWVDVDIS